MKPFSISIIWQKKSCWGCGSKSVIRWGKRNGHQRFKCKHCGILFQWDNYGVTKANRFVWFRKWIMDRRVYRTLSGEMQMSNRSISRLFKNYLDQAPVILVKSKSNVHLIIDGTYLPNGFVYFFIMIMTFATCSYTEPAVRKNLEKSGRIYRH